jgi:uncharacterized protein (DUF2252 family)
MDTGGETPRHLRPEERAALGYAAREKVSRAELGEYTPPAGRDPLAVLRRQDQARQQDLVPLRYARMSASPFAFLRGSAAVMAADIGGAPVTGLRVQAIGDAHLSNFGVFGSPERRLIFDVNDFDETLPAPWEWDVKRLVASVVVAAEENGARRKEAEVLAQATAAAYRRSLRVLAADPTLAVWYAHLDVEELAQLETKKKARARETRNLEKIRRQTSAKVVGKLAEVVDGRLRFKSLPPLVTPLRELIDEAEIERTTELIKRGFVAYKDSLAPERRLLLERFRVVDMARKVVGVGSVGTRCLVALLLGRDENDPLVLQLKEANHSVLEPFAGAGPCAHQGERVVNGQRLVQAASDIFLGWSDVDGDPERDYYWRQLKDMKASAEINLLDARSMQDYLNACAWCLAHAHARSGDPIAIASYLGDGATFDKAMADFASAYAAQTREDWEALTTAIAGGAIAAEPEA